MKRVVGVRIKVLFEIQDIVFWFVTPCHDTGMTDAAWSSKTMVFYITARSHNPENNDLHLHYHENIKSHTI